MLTRTSQDLRTCPLPPSASGFTDVREKELEELKDLIKKEDEIVIWGLSGMGKTTLARKLANDLYNKEKFVQAVLWTPVGQQFQSFDILRDWGRKAINSFNPSKDENLEQLALNVKSFLTNLINEKCEKCEPKRVLVVFDDVHQHNVDKVELVRNYACPDNAKIVVTTIEYKAAAKFYCRAFKLKELDEERGIKLLRKELPNWETEHLRNLVIKRNGNLLKMREDASSLNAQPIVRQSFEKRLYPNFEKNDKTLENQDNNITSSFSFTESNTLEKAERKLEEGLEEFKNRKYKEAITTYHTVNDFLSKASASDKKATIFVKLGEAFYKAGDIELAISLYQEARNVFRRLKDEKSFAHISSVLSSLYREEANTIRKPDSDEKIQRDAQLDVQTYLERVQVQVYEQDFEGVKNNMSRKVDLEDNIIQTNNLINELREELKSAANAREKGRFNPDIKNTKDRLESFVKDYVTSYQSGPFPIPEEVWNAIALFPEYSKLVKQTNNLEPNLIGKPSDKEVLFLAAVETATSTAQTPGRAFNIILEACRNSNLKVVAESGVRISDIPAALNRHKSNILHIYSHGEVNQNGDGFLVFTDRDNNRSLLRDQRFVEILKRGKGNLRCVVVNACDSLVFARKVVEVVDCSIGMAREISEGAVWAFIEGFYRELASGGSVNEAFEMGKQQMIIEDFKDEEDIPQLIGKEGVDLTALKFTE